MLLAASPLSVGPDEPEHDVLEQVMPAKKDPRKAPAKQITLTFEVSRACNLRCEFCYNAWKIEGKQETGEAPTGLALKLLEKAIAETGCGEITLSGGEPLLRKDIFDLIRLIKKRGVKVALVTNGTLLTRELADKCVSEGVDLFQVSLLSDLMDLHDSLAGCAAFDKAIEGILNARNAGGSVCTFFVGTSRNIHTFRGALELNALLGVRNVALGRFVPGGEGMHRWRALLPEPEALQAALDSASELSKRYPMAISIATPILPCLVDLSRYDNLDLGFCAVGRPATLFAIDPVGNVKACSHSPQVLGNLLETPFKTIAGNTFIKDFVRTLPEYCRDCAAAAICRAGCRSSAHLCYGSFEAEDPYLATYKARADKSRPEVAALSGRREGAAG